MSLLADRPDQCSGLYQKYKVERRDGKPCPEAEYFILRVDKDDAHGKASRLAAKAYADAIRDTNSELASDIHLWIDQINKVWNHETVPSS